MARFYESALIDSTDGIQFKVYSSTHPKGFIIAKPKYVPSDIINLVGLKKRFLFSKCMFRFNLFNNKAIVKKNMDAMRQKFPYYIYKCSKHKNWFLGVPENKVKKFYDTKKAFRLSLCFQLKRKVILCSCCFLLRFLFAGFLLFLSSFVLSWDG